MMAQKEAVHEGNATALTYTYLYLHAADVLNNSIKNVGHAQEAIARMLRRVKRVGLLY